MMRRMGLFKKVLRAADKVDQAKASLEHEIFKDRRYGRAEKLAASGDPGTAVITGIRRRLSDSTTHTDVRLEWFAPEPRVGAIHYGSRLPPAIRLGSTVAIKADGDAAVLDPAAMAEAPGGPPDVGRTTRKVPDRGLDDRALDQSVLGRIRKWTPYDASVVSFERVSALGMPTENWTIVVTAPDGTRATVTRDEVPPYARWFVAPGAVVPVVIDPGNPGRAQIDWPELAERAAVVGGAWQEDPPPGSIAASLLSRSEQVEEAPAAAMGASLDLTPAGESAAAIEGITIERCAYVEAALIQARVPPQDHDAYASTELEVPSGRWAAIRSQWQARQLADWKVGAAYGAAFEAAQRDLKKR